MSKIIIPPIKSQGIKTKLVPFIKENIDFNTNHIWIEPFMGTGVVGFNMKPKEAIFADTNLHIINFYNSLKKKIITPNILRSFLEEESIKLQKNGVLYYLEVRKRFNEKHNSLDFIFLNRSCFNGIMRFNSKGGFNVPFCKKNDRFSKSYITKIVNQTRNIYELIQDNNYSFRHQDFKKTLSETTGTNLSFIYCDPPYIDRHSDYHNKWNEENEIDLFNLLSNINTRFLLSTWYGNEYRENKYIKSLWGKFNIITTKHHYHVGASQSNRKSMIESLIYNY